MTEPSSPFDRLETELVAAAARQAAGAERPVRKRRRGTTLLVALLALSGTGAAAWAASALLESGDPVGFERNAPVPGRGDGAPLPGSVRVPVSVDDPQGGPRWALRTWETDRGFTCVQVGRLNGGQFGVITDGRVFRALPVGAARSAVGGCYPQDARGHALVAVRAEVATGASAPPCPPADRLKSAPAEARAQCAAPRHTVDFGLLGPRASSLVYSRGHRGSDPAGPDGAYLAVQPGPVATDGGAAHGSDDVLGVTTTPVPPTIAKVVYDAGVCRVRTVASVEGSCLALAGYVPLRERAPSAVSAPVSAELASDGRTVEVAFRAPATVRDATSGYVIEVSAVGSAAVAVRHAYRADVLKGQRVRVSVATPAGRASKYRVSVRYRTASVDQPTPSGALEGPEGADARGLLVGSRVLPGG